MEKLLVGTYTRNNMSQGLYEVFVNESDFSVGQDAKRIIENPIYFTLNQKKNRLVSITKNNTEGGVALFDIGSPEATMKLLDKSMQPDVGACDICLSKNERFVITAHYGAGRLEVHEILDNKTLKLHQVIDHKVYEEKDQQSRVHFARLMDDGKIIVCDLGLDKVFVYAFSEETGNIDVEPLQVVKVEQGSGPRNFATNKQQNRLYVINELDTTLDIFSYEHGSLNFLEKLKTVEAYNEGMSGAAIKLTKDNQYLYVSIRGGYREPDNFEDNFLIAFKILSDGRLEKIAQTSVEGNHPRDFEISRDDKYIYVANQLSNNLTLFAIDEAGRPNFTGSVLALPAPVCIKVMG